MRADGRIRLIGASAAHVGRVAYRMREADRLELAAKGRDPKAALRLSLDGASWAMTALLDGVPHAMFGVTPLSLVEDRGMPWFLGSEEVYRHGRIMLATGHGIIDLMHKTFHRLENFVSADNDRAIRLLKRWGFTVEGEVMMMGGVPFVQFWREAHV